VTIAVVMGEPLAERALAGGGRPVDGDDHGPKLVLHRAFDQANRFPNFGKSRWIDDDRISDLSGDLCRPRIRIVKYPCKVCIPEKPRQLSERALTTTANFGSRDVVSTLSNS
jgi:hypothetical protein